MDATRTPITTTITLEGMVDVATEANDTTGVMELIAGDTRCSGTDDRSLHALHSAPCGLSSSLRAAVPQDCGAPGIDA